MKKLIVTLALLMCNLALAYTPNIKLQNGAYLIADSFSLNQKYSKPKVWVGGKTYPICENAQRNVVQKLLCADPAKPFADYRLTTLGLFQSNAVMIHEDLTLSVVKCEREVIFEAIECVATVNQLGGE